MTDGLPPEAEPPVPAASPWKALVLAVFVVACVAVVYFTPLREIVGRAGFEDLRRRVRELGDWAPWAFFAGTALGVAIGVPRLALAALGGAIFGWLLGAALSQAGAFVGCWITFGVGRALGREYVAAIVRRRFPRAATLLGFVGRHGFAANVILRLVPVGNSFATSLLMALSPVALPTFLSGTFLGMLPETVIFALFGSAAGGEKSGLRLAVGAASMVVLALFVWWWTRRLSRARGARSDTPIQRNPGAPSP